MAKPSKNKSKNGKSGRKSTVAPSRAVKSSPVRNTPVPKPVAAARRSTNGGTTRKPITHEMIAERAYFIAMSGNGGSEHDNWTRAERELRGGI